MTAEEKARWHETGEMPNMESMVIPLPDNNPTWDALSHEEQQKVVFVAMMLGSTRDPRWASQHAEFSRKGKENFDELSPGGRSALYTLMYSRWGFDPSHTDH